ncbi:MAG: pilin [Patescibacteria group bacterium]
MITFKKIKSFPFLFSFLMLSFLIIIPFVTVSAQSPRDPCPPGIICSPYPQDFTIVSFLNFILENIVLPIGGVIAVLFLVYAGFLFVTARGNEEQLEHAKSTLKWTIIGIAILFGSLVISNGIKDTICQIANIPSFCR